jgi:cellobiose-specific phosphotransferase system component IIA
MNKSENINELASALAKAQAEIRGAVEDSTNPHFRSKYASLQSYIDSAREPLARHGLSVTQLLTQSDCGTNMVSIETVMMHSSGQWISAVFSVPVGNQMTAQAFGSAVTYARRYSFASIVGIAPIDDDGNQATASMASASMATATEEKTVKKLPASVIKYITSADDAEALLTWGKQQDPTIQKNTQFRSMFQAKYNELKSSFTERGAEA